jgi:hypothetical protein
MAVDQKNFFQSIKKRPNDFLIIHYSTESLYDEGLQGLSPRITSIVVMHFDGGQTNSFAIHTAAEQLGIPKDDVATRYDEIESHLLKDFYNFVKTARDKYWVHWQMKSVKFGFEHIEHRFKYLTKETPQPIPVENRISLVDCLRQRYGDDFAPHPQMREFMLLQGELPRSFLMGDEESASFGRKEFVTMNASTISKVQFFAYAIALALKGKLRTAGRSYVLFVDRLLENRYARLFAFTASACGFIYLIARVSGLAHQQVASMARPPLDRTLWRYMSLPKFLWLLQNKKLWFSRADLLSDPCES